MAEFERKAVDKIYRGAYQYFFKGIVYAEEQFEIFRFNQDYSHRVESEVSFRLMTGEIFILKITAVFSKDWVPQVVHCYKHLGLEVVQEVFQYTPQYNKINYQYKSEDLEKKGELATPPKFSFGLPCVATSCLFLFIKKLDSSGQASFPYLLSSNLWTFNSFPKMSAMACAKKTTSLESIIVNENKLKCHLYEIFPLDEKSDFGKSQVYISTHLNLPYVIQWRDYTYQVVYLNHLDEK